MDTLGPAPTADLVRAMSPAATARVVAGSGAESIGELVKAMGPALTGRLVVELGPQLGAEVSVDWHLRMHPLHECLYLHNFLAFCSPLRRPHSSW